LSQISRRSSPCHDGFHLVSSSTHSITDISQFFSPPIPAVQLEPEYATGARHMAARLGSLVPDVTAVAICTSFDGFSMYIDGEIRRLAL
jgi:hypothetical protein